MHVFLMSCDYSGPNMDQNILQREYKPVNPHEHIQVSSVRTFWFSPTLLNQYT